MRENADREIVERCFARDEAALEKAEERYGALLKRICMNILGSEQDAEECANDALYKMWTSIPPQRPDNLRAYLAAIARNAALNVYEKQKRERRVPGEMTSALEELSEILPDRTTVEDEITGRELTGLVDRFLAKLPKRARLIFLYRFYFCFSTPKIAGILKIGERGVQASLKRSKEKLKEFLMKEGYIL